MDKKNTYIVGGLIGLAFLGFLFVFLRSQTMPVEPQVTNTATTTGVRIPTLITAKHAYKNGEHILTGDINLPTQCHLLEQTVTILPDESRATIAFTRSFKGGDCPGGEKSTRFLVKFKSRSDTVIRTTVDGSEVQLSLIEAAPGEDLENTEIYLKG